MTNQACRLSIGDPNRFFDHGTRCTVVFELEVSKRQADQLTRPLLCCHRPGRCTGEHLREGWVYPGRFLHNQNLALKADFHKFRQAELQIRAVAS